MAQPSLVAAWLHVAVMSTRDRTVETPIDRHETCAALLMPCAAHNLFCHVSLAGWCPAALDFGLMLNWAVAQADLVSPQFACHSIMLRLDSARRVGCAILHHLALAASRLQAPLHTGHSDGHTLKVVTIGHPMTL